MDKPPYRFVATSLELIGELDSIRDNCTESFDSASPAARENAVANRLGIKPQVYISIPDARLHLHLKLYAAREHLLSCIYLVGSNAERTLVNSIQALTRSAVEASAACLWLCSNKIPWEERLQRFSQLHLRSAYTCLVEEGIDPNDRPERLLMDQDSILTLDECDTLISEVKGRGWTCTKGKNRGGVPTISKWVRELPSYSELVKEASAIVPISPTMLRTFYSMSSRSVHTDPVTVASGSTEEDESARFGCAAVAMVTAFLFYAMAWKLVASWCSVPFPEDAVWNRITELHRLAEFD